MIYVYYEYEMSMMSIYDLNIESIVPVNKLMAHYLIGSDKLRGLYNNKCAASIVKRLVS